MHELRVSGETHRLLPTEAPGYEIPPLLFIVFILVIWNIIEVPVKLVVAEKHLYHLPWVVVEHLV